MQCSLVPEVCKSVRRIKRGCLSGVSGLRVAWLGKGAVYCRGLNNFLLLFGFPTINILQRSSKTLFQLVRLLH